MTLTPTLPLTAATKYCLSLFLKKMMKGAAPGMLKIPASGFDILPQSPLAHIPVKSIADLNDLAAAPHNVAAPIRQTKTNQTKINNGHLTLFQGNEAGRNMTTRLDR